MSGLEPIKMKDGGFPDLTGDGKVTQADILKGRGVEGFKEGGRPSRPTSTGYEGGVSQFIKDFIVDYEDPSDIALMSLMLAGPLGVGVNRGIKALRTAKKLSKGKQDYKTSGIEDLIDRAIIKKGKPIAGGALGYDITSALLEDDDITEMKEGGIVHAARGKAIVKFGKKFLDQVKKDPKLRNKDGSPKKSTKAYKDEIARQEAAKKTAANKKRAETRRRNQEAKVKQDAEKPMTSGQQSKKVLEETIPEGGAGNQGTFLQKTKKPLLATSALAAGVIGVPALMNMETTPVEGGRRNRSKKTDDDGTFINGDGADNAGVRSVFINREDPVMNDSLMSYIKQDLAGKGFYFDPQTQTFTGDKKPSFFDYVKSLPSGYMEKVGDDPDYAKKMMAGFLNMMKPVEGFVPVNPVVAFGEGYLGEETRQADMLPADAKLLEYFKNNPEAYKDMLALEKARAGAIGDYERKRADEQAEGIKRDLISKNPNYTVDYYQNLNVFYKDPVTNQPIGPIDGTVLMSLQDRGLQFFENEFYLEPK